MATISFKPRGTKEFHRIYICVSNGRDKITQKPNIFRRYTGFDIKVKDWSKATGRPKQSDASLKKLDTDLNELKFFIHKSLNDANSSGIDVDGEWVQYQLDIFNGKVKPKTSSEDDPEKDRLTNCFDRYITLPPLKRMKNKVRSRSTVTKYTTLKYKVQNFEKYTNKKYYVKDVNIAFRDNFFEYLTTQEKLADNTAGRYLSFVKTVCLDAKIRGAETHPELEVFSGTSEEAHKIFLTFDEIYKIETTKFKRVALDNARDWLVIGCYIGQRVSDLLNLNASNIIQKNGLELIELTQKKTGKKVVIPISEPVRKILDKRKGDFPTKISAAKFNLHIKEVARLAGITDIVEGAKIDNLNTDKETKNGAKPLYRKVIGKFEKWELVTSHICRRSFATNYYGEMITPLIINITGHSTEKQFLEYVGKKPLDHAQQIAEYFSSIYQKQMAKRK
jgi:integrase